MTRGTMAREAGIPLEAALRGIDTAFDKYETRQKKGRMRKINGLAWCAQAVMEAAEELREAAAGSTAPSLPCPRYSLPKCLAKSSEMSCTIERPPEPWVRSTRPCLRSSGFT